MITVSGGTRAASRRAEHVFYFVMAAAAIATAFFGFARTYFLRSYFQTTALAPLVKVHGAAFTAWVLLFLVQTTLVSVRRTDVHRTLGWAGAALATFMCVLTLRVAVTVVHAAVLCCNADAARKFFLIPVADVIVFATLVAAAVAYRREPGTHKRLMLLATLTILDAATTRWPLHFIQTTRWGYYAALDVIVLAAAAYDIASTRRIARAFAWGVPLVIGAHIARELLGATTLWKSFARLIVG